MEWKALLPTGHPDSAAKGLGSFLGGSGREKSRVYTFPESPKLLVMEALPRPKGYWVNNCNDPPTPYPPPPSRMEWPIAVGEETGEKWGGVALSKHNVTTCMPTGYKPPLTQPWDSSPPITAHLTVTCSQVSSWRIPFRRIPRDMYSLALASCALFWTLFPTASFIFAFSLIFNIP